VPAARRALPRRHQPRPTHRGCPARRRGLGLSNGRRDTGVASTRSPVAPHTASHERAPAARTYMRGRVLACAAFPECLVSSQQPRAWLSSTGYTCSTKFMYSRAPADRCSPRSTRPDRRRSARAAAPPPRHARHVAAREHTQTHAPGSRRPEDLRRRAEV
jgi:hypothetical protein